MERRHRYQRLTPKHLSSSKPIAVMQEREMSTCGWYGAMRRGRKKLTGRPNSGQNLEHEAICSFQRRQPFCHT
jgi:hypothetical protein